MYPDLSYILHALIGTQPDNAFSIVKTFGLMLVVAILFAAFMLERELRRKEKEGLFQPVKKKITIGEPASVTELILNALLGFVLISKVFYAFSHFAEFQNDPADVLLSMKGTWWAGILGAAIFAAIKYFEKKKDQLPKPEERLLVLQPHDRIGDITMIAALAGVIGAKIFAMLEDLDLLFSGQLTLAQYLGQFFSGSGMAIYGGLIVAFTTVYFYLRRHQITPIHVMDAVAPALLVAYGIGRLGCQLSGDGDWGIPIEAFSNTGELLYSYTKPGWIPQWLWAQSYAHNVINEGLPIEGCTWRYCHQLATPVFPTSVYETIMAVGLGGFLWAIRKRVTIPGLLFFLYLVMNGFERFWIEKIRVNERYDILGFQTTQAEFIAVILMIIGIIGCVVLWQRSKKSGAAA